MRHWLDEAAPGSNGRIRVAYLTTRLGPGGAERQMVYLAAALPRDRFDPHIVLFSGGGAYVDEAREAGIPIHVLGLSRRACRDDKARCLRGLLRSAARYRRLVRDFHIVDAWTVPAYTFAGLLRPVAPVPVVIAGRRSLPGVDRTRTALRELGRAWAMARVDAVVANSQAAATAAIDEEGLDPRSVHVIRNAVVGVPTTEGARQRQREAWGMTSSDVVVGCIATMRPLKGHRLLIEVASRLHDSHPALRYVLIGDGPMLEEVQGLVQAFGLEGIVRFDTGQADARHAYDALDIVIQTSESEGLPNVVLEAASAAKPILATAVGGTPEIITDAVDGILVPSGDADAIVAALTRLVDDASLRARLAQAAAARAREFSIERLVGETASLYEGLLDAYGRSQAPVANTRADAVRRDGRLHVDEETAAHDAVGPG